MTGTPRYVIDRETGDVRMVCPDDPAPDIQPGDIMHALALLAAVRDHYAGIGWPEDTHAVAQIEQAIEILRGFMQHECGERAVG